MSNLPTRREALENPLPPFDPEARCPKCDYDDVGTSHRADGCRDTACGTCPAEALVRTCRRCSFQWAEAPVKKEARA